MTDFKRHNFKKLKIWQMAMEIANVVFDLITEFPDEERFGLVSQINRCAVSIPSNIAEGSSRTNKSFSHFLDISLGSSFELQTQLILSNSRRYIADESLNILENKLEEFQKATMTFQNTLNQ
jgi:four helix bundle protein